MPKIVYNKLVRDRIPEIIQKSGKDFKVLSMDEPAYEKALLDKLLEEAKELIEAPKDERIKEFSDLQEVLEAIQLLWDIDTELIQERKQKRAKERGAFTQRLKLLWVKE